MIILILKKKVEIANTKFKAKHIERKKNTHNIYTYTYGTIFIYILEREEQA